MSLPNSSRALFSELFRTLAFWARCRGLIWLGRLRHQVFKARIHLSQAAFSLNLRGLQFLVSHPKFFRFFLQLRYAKPQLNQEQSESIRQAFIQRFLQEFFKDVDAGGESHGLEISGAKIGGKAL